MRAAGANLGQGGPALRPGLGPTKVPHGMQMCQQEQQGERRDLRNPVKEWIGSKADSLDIRHRGAWIPDGAGWRGRQKPVVK